MPPASLLALWVAAACWDIHSPNQSTLAQCPSLLEHQKLRQGDIHGDTHHG